MYSTAVGAHSWGPTGVQLQPLLLSRSWSPWLSDLASLCLSFRLCAAGMTLVQAEECLSRVRMDSASRPGRATPDSRASDDVAGAEQVLHRLTPCQPCQGGLSASQTQNLQLGREASAPNKSRSNLSASLGFPAGPPCWVGYYVYLKRSPTVDH